MPRVILALAVCGAALAGTPAAAQEANPTAAPAIPLTPPANVEGRFTLSPINEGYVRFDSRTGQVSVCGKRPAGWSCQPMVEERAALENEIARLYEENASLKKELVTRGLPLPGAPKGEPPVARNERSLATPSDPNIERMKVMVEDAWRRLLDLIAALQKDAR